MNSAARIARQKRFWRYYAASALDAYISCWVVLELAMLVLLLDVLPGVVLTIVVAYRLVEIVQVFANAVLFDRWRSLKRGYVIQYMVLSAPRSIVHTIVLLGETILCFAILFYAQRGWFDGYGSAGIQNAVDAMDTSLRTITTIGPAASAHGAFRLVVDLEPIFGLLFAGTVLARAINAMPRVEDTQQGARAAGQRQTPARGEH